MITGESITFHYTGDMQEILLTVGEYIFECYGASGAGTGGKGGYSKAFIEIDHPTIFYVGVGGNDRTFNGGTQTYYNHTGSGGGTHIAYTNTQIKNTNKADLLLVAGGGGGGCKNGDGGYGGGCNASGGLNGGTGTGGYSNRLPGTGGTQTAGGKAQSGYSTTSGSYGQGGTNTGGTGSGGSMGGGGYYGGGPGGSDYSRYNDNDDGSGGGGSGYVNLSIMYDASGGNGVNKGHGYVVITALYAGKIQKNSNFYKDSYPQEIFNYETLQKLLEV